MIRTTLAAVLFVLPAAAFAQSTTPPPAPARYVDLVDWPASESSFQRFYDAEAALGRAFDKVCGDTFCEGDYGNLRPMQLRCSVDATKGTVKQCLWTFAGSYAGVNPKSGAVQVNARLYKCRLPLAKDTPAEQFFQLIEGENPLEAKLPMSRASIYDGLATCL
ncbi:hypothetical protein P3W24_14440 [Luteibacter sp. PPL201]|uniref:DUF3617 family protein n=1 Tax=Luteibacter sahnii TaxID=3021977 RepID=A0ABT6BDK8_9GAMM